MVTCPFVKNGTDKNSYDEPCNHTSNNGLTPVIVHKLS